MRVFVTGASGFVGSAVTRQLVAAGHHVTGLARSDNSASIVEKAGGTVLRGDLADPDGLAAAAKEADGVIHCAFIHDFSNFGASVEADKHAIEAMGVALAGSDKPLIVTSGTAAIAPGRVATEEDDPDANIYEGTPRVSEQTALGFVDSGVRAQVMRLPPSVHGAGEHGFIPMIIQTARDKGRSAYIGDGSNVWPAVHREDAARAYVLALEKGDAGQRHNAIGDEGIPFRRIAETIGRKLGVPTVSVPANSAADHFGWMAAFARLDVPASADITRRRLGWQPTGPGLIEDMENGGYF